MAFIIRGTGARGPIVVAAATASDSIELARALEHYGMTDISIANGDAAPQSVAEFVRATEKESEKHKS